MLQLHQIGGFITLAGLAATVVVGQLNYADKYGGGGDTGKYLTAHETLAIGTSAVFAATGLLAIFRAQPDRQAAPTLRHRQPGCTRPRWRWRPRGLAAEIVLGVLTANHEQLGGQSRLSAPRPSETSPSPHQVIELHHAGGDRGRLHRAYLLDIQ